MSKFNVGDKVRYVGSEHDINSQWYPSIGTIGTVVQDVDEIDCYIQWPKGSTSKEDCWYCDENDIELVENVDMTNEEIWKMLESKTRKNGLKPCGSRLLFTNGISNVYAWEDVHNAIALAYKVGYLRSQKGRPFKIGEKKKKGGHWEPVDSNNLPKEGTRVRYVREHNAYKSTPEFIKLGEIGIFSYSYTGAPGLKTEGNLFCPWVSFATNISCLDMWVEDDE